MVRLGKSTLWFIFVGVCAHELYALLSGYLLALDVTQFETRPLWQRSLLVGGLQEPLLFLVCATVFFVAGAVLVAPYRLRLRAAVAIAFLFGFLFSGFFVLEPHGIFYSHAPAWLYTLAWSPFYVPPIAAVFGALALPRIKGLYGGHMNSSRSSVKNAH